MTASRKSAKKRIVVVRRKSSTKKYTPPKLPSSSPVNQGCKSFGRTKTGQYIVPRFTVTAFTTTRKYRWNKDRKVWWVVDMDTANIANGTSKDGYQKKEAIIIAKKYRDEYGNWSVVPF